MRTLMHFIGLALLIYLLSILNYHTLAASILKAKPAFLIIAFLLLVPVYLIKAWRWKFMLRLQGIHYPYRDAFLGFWSSNFIAFVTPGRLGEVAKAFYLMKDKGLPFSSSLPTVVFDRLFDMYTLWMFSVAGAVVFATGRIGMLNWLLVTVLLVFPLLIFWKGMVKGFFNAFLSLPLLNRYRSGFLRGLDGFYQEVSALVHWKSIGGLLLTIAAYLILFYCSYWISRASASDLPYMQVSYFMAVVALLSFLPITIAGFGTREAALVILFSQISRSREEAILFSTLYFFVFFALGGLMGYFCFLLKPVEFKKLKAFAKKPAADTV